MMGWLWVGISPAQTNLVINGSFEQYYNCPASSYDFPEVKDWTNAEPSTSPDYYNVCDTGFWWFWGLPRNGVGFQPTSSGNAYIGIFTLNTGTPDQGREYIQTKLADTLIAGNKYLVKMYVSLANPMKYSIRTLGMYFTPSPVTGSSGMLYAPTAQVVNSSANSLADTVSWVLIQDTLTAAGGELYLTIGNFFYDNQSDTFAYNPSTTTYTFASYYYIDDVSVLDLSSIGIKENIKGESISVFPNPASGQIFIESADLNNKVSKIIVVNSFGKTVLESDLELKEKVKVDLSTLEQGVYFYKIIVDNVAVKTERLIIVK
ncbi:MAG: T9SS type A sorting domain-containing protein [Bacteroidia bacterium]